MVPWQEVFRPESNQPQPAHADVLASTIAQGQLADMLLQSLSDIGKNFVYLSFFNSNKHRSGKDDPSKIAIDARGGSDAPSQYLS